MDENRKRELRRRYLIAQYVINAALDNYSCGLEIIKLLNLKVAEACQEIEAIKAEVRQEMAKEAYGASQIGAA